MILAKQVLIAALNTLLPYSQKKAHYLEFQQRSMLLQTVTISWFKAKATLGLRPPVSRTLTDYRASYVPSCISSVAEN